MSGLKSSLTQHDVRFVNEVPFRVKQTVKQGEAFRHGYVVVDDSPPQRVLGLSVRSN